MSDDIRPLPDAGWYPDPRERGRERRWDGTAWTDETRTAQPRPVVVAEPVAQPVAPTPQPAAPRPTTPTQPGFDPFAPVGFGAPAPRQQPQAPQAPYGPQAPHPSQPASQPRPGGIALASFGRRVLACLLDSLIVQVVVSLCTIPIYLKYVEPMREIFAKLAGGADPNEMATAMVELISDTDALLVTGIGFAVWFVYGGIMLSWLGATVGYLAAGIRLRDVNGGKVPAGRAWGRSFGWALLELMGQLPLLLFVQVWSCVRMLWHPRRQTFPDTIAGTIVVREP